MLNNVLLFLTGVVSVNFIQFGWRLLEDSPKLNTWCQIFVVRLIGGMLIVGGGGLFIWMLRG